ncbi:hypothetical protein BHM03_00028099 [Ensete ventricosum]|uniref:Cyclin N-terminal domain-containing protein n=1 Tax=Ensete ventricosum TaxID=4639 RepID=A0A426Y2Q7_ENSVE|nr:hypothetical protein B296_00037012 [Ensete ventricosum]RZR98678.1 hypothetical protein BHM03_00028099 [Ensete ventricosum]
MSPSCDCASSILLCAEDNDSILGFDDGEEEGGHRPGWVPEPKRCDFYGDVPAGFPLQSDELLSLLVEREQEHLPREDYRERLCKAWMTQLLSVACLSLAAKMEEIEVPLSLDLQVRRHQE